MQTPFLFVLHMSYTQKDALSKTMILSQLILNNIFMVKLWFQTVSLFFQLQPFTLTYDTYKISMNTLPKYNTDVLLLN